jgi:hypothetical protein
VADMIQPYANRIYPHRMSRRGQQVDPDFSGVDDKMSIADVAVHLGILQPKTVDGLAPSYKGNRSIRLKDLYKNRR